MKRVGTDRGEPFGDRLVAAVEAKGSAVVLGLDPHLPELPPPVREEARRRLGATCEAVADAFVQAGRALIDATCDFVIGVKLQLGCYEQYGAAGQEALAKTAAHARARGLLVVGDGKRGDIARSAAAYAGAYLGEVPFWDGTRLPGLGMDALTVNPFLGSDAVAPFLEACRTGRGIFVLVRTSNPSAGELQDRVEDELCRLLHEWNRGLAGRRGYGPVGAVVAGTAPQVAARLRRALPGVPFLVPGYGPQGGTAAQAAACFDETGLGAVVAASRWLAAAWEREPFRSRYGAEGFAQAAREAARALRDELRQAVATGRGERR